MSSAEQSTNSGINILLTNGLSTQLTLASSSITGSSSQQQIALPPSMLRGTYGGYGTDASTTPYTATWSYTPDGGETLLSFTCAITGRTGITIQPSAAGPQADQWALSEEPSFDGTTWTVRFYYQAA